MRIGDVGSKINTTPVEGKIGRKKVVEPKRAAGSPEVEAQPSPSGPGQELFVSSDMATMLEDIERNYPGTIKGKVKVEPPVSFMAPVTSGTSSDNTSRIEQSQDTVKTEGHRSTEGARHALLGGHLVFEAGEIMAQGASSEVEAVASEVNRQVSGHVVNHAHKLSHHLHKAHHLHYKPSIGFNPTDLAADATQLSTTMAGALAAGAVGSVAVGAAMTYFGVKELKHGIKKKDSDAMLEGTGAILVGARSGLAAASMANMVTQSPVLHAVAGVAHSVVAPLGVAHGAIDTFLGAKDLYQGGLKPLVKGEELDKDRSVRGALGVGLGVSLMASAVGGGIPAVAAALVFLGGKIAYRAYEARVENSKGEAA